MIFSLFENAIIYSDCEKRRLKFVSIIISLSFKIISFIYNLLDIGGRVVFDTITLGWLSMKYYPEMVWIELHL